MIRISHFQSKPNLIPCSSFNLASLNINLPSKLHIPNKTQPNNLIFSTTKSTLLNCSLHTHTTPTSPSNESNNNAKVARSPQKNFWGAVTLIVGTAVGPGMLGLPSATIKSGSFPSTFVILLCWVYVISSIILVAELSFASMEQDGVVEVSYTSLAIKALGSKFGAFVAVVYASLSFALLVACVSGIGSIVSQWFLRMNVVLAHALFPVCAGIVIGFFPFDVIDTANRLLCLIMLVSITALVAIGLSVARTRVFGSFGGSSWSVASILPAIPVAVLTLGFHVITPFICKIAGDTVWEARKAILIGGAVPLVMVLSWNLIVLRLAGAKTVNSSNDPISLLLSVNPAALPAVQGFAFSALATSLIGYAVSFPKQLLDTLELIFQKNSDEDEPFFLSQLLSSRTGRVGSISFSSRGTVGHVLFNGARSFHTSKTEIASSLHLQKLLMMLVLVAPIIIASFFPSTFSRALDFAGIYANCFLFGILPPLMAFIQQYRKRLRSSILPGGDATLLLLFIISVSLAIWH